MYQRINKKTFKHAPHTFVYANNIAIHYNHCFATVQNFAEKQDS